MVDLEAFRSVQKRPPCKGICERGKLSREKIMVMFALGKNRRPLVVVLDDYGLQRRVQIYRP